MMHNIRRQKEACRVRLNRVISEYVEIKHPEIYAEAKKVYTKLDTLYPMKKDLRKTYEFCLFTSGLKDNKYKYTRKLQDDDMVGLKDNKYTRKLQDDMVLEIPLMDMSAVSTVVPAVVPTIAPAVAPAIPTVVPAVVPTVAPAVAPAIPAVAPAVVADEIIPDVGGEVTLPVVADEIIDEIIMNLRQDPDIGTFFDEILTDGETPLEEELTALGF